MRAVDAEPAHAAVQGGAIAAEPPCGFRDIPFAGSERGAQIGLLAPVARAGAGLQEG